MYANGNGVERDLLIAVASLHTLSSDTVRNRRIEDPNQNGTAYQDICGYDTAKIADEYRQGANNLVPLRIQPLPLHLSKYIPQAEKIN
jgi:hypothetical protein